MGGSTGTGDSHAAEHHLQQGGMPVLSQTVLGPRADVADDQRQRGHTPRAWSPTQRDARAEVVVTPMCRRSWAEGAPTTAISRGMEVVTEALCLLSSCSTSTPA